MKIEARGKYPGVKVHLDEGEVQSILNMKENYWKANLSVSFISKLAQKISVLLAEEPGLLTTRTPEQIKASVEEELKKLQEKLDAIIAGEDWKADKDAWVEPVRANSKVWFGTDSYFQAQVEATIHECQERGWIPKRPDGSLILNWIEFAKFYQKMQIQMAESAESKLLNNSKGGMKL